jgi:hypothetical protein
MDSILSGARDAQFPSFDRKKKKKKTKLSLFIIIIILRLSTQLNSTYIRQQQQQ